jgi:hypothetical protein
MVECMGIEPNTFKPILLVVTENFEISTCTTSMYRSASELRDYKTGSTSRARTCDPVINLCEY